MRIYIACLSSYNAGILHGAWVDRDESTDVEDIQEAIDAVLKSSPQEDAEEYAIHDYDGIPSSFGEWPDFEELLEYVKGKDRHGAAWEAFVDCFGEDVTLEQFEDAFVGEFKDREDFAYSNLEDSGQEIPEWLSSYVDYDAIGRDLLISDYSGSTVNHTLYVFRGDF